MSANLLLDENTAKGLFFVGALVFLVPLWIWDRRRRRKLTETQKPPQV